MQQLHVFPYSERPGTQALNIPYIVSDSEKKVRSQRLLQLSDEKLHSFYIRYIGEEAEVLVERATRSKPMTGFTPNYIRVEMPDGLDYTEYDNKLVRVRLEEYNKDNNALKGVLI